jgi:hypothetical protein
LREKQLPQRRKGAKEKEKIFEIAVNKLLVKSQDFNPEG